MRPPLRRALLFAVAVLVAGTCVRLGMWQLQRLDERRAANATVEAGLSADPLTEQELEDAIRDGDQASLSYRRVLLRGEFDVASEVLWYGRPLDGRPGGHLLTPLVLASGASILVDRGWVPSSLEAPYPGAEPPGGSVTLEGFLFPPDGGRVVESHDGVPTEVSAADPSLLAGPAGLLPLPLQLQEQTPPQGGDLPVLAPPPSFGEGPHRSYAFQWFSFAAIAVVGYVVLARRDRGSGVEHRHPGREEVG